MAHSPGPLTVEELSQSAETERELGITRIICAPSDIAEDKGESMAVAFVIHPANVPLFASVLDLLAVVETLDLYAASFRAAFPGNQIVGAMLRDASDAIAKAKGQA